jgi:hypothetical protein
VAHASHDKVQTIKYRLAPGFRLKLKQPASSETTNRRLMAKKTQIEKFREAAREAGSDDSEERFNETLKGLAKKPRDAKAGVTVPPASKK